MKIQAKVKNPVATVVEMKIEMSMGEWDFLSDKLDHTGVEGELKDKICDLQRAMTKVVTATVGEET